MSKKCIVCGTELDNTAVFCDECGAKQGDAKEIRIQSERNKLIEDLEKTEQIGISISTTEMMKNECYEELEELKNRAEGVNNKLLIIAGIIVLIGTIVCLKKFGIIGGIIGFFICCKIGDIIEFNVRKLLNMKNKTEIEAAKKEYMEKKDKLEGELEKYRNEIEELKNDIVYRKYAYLLTNDAIPLIRRPIINALKEGKADTLEEAIRYENINPN